MYTGNEYLSIGFKTENVYTKHRELIAKGQKTSPLISPNSETHFFFIEDPAGVKVQFM